MKTQGEENETTPCLYGWEYDTTWLSLTAASQEDWVCDKELYPNTVYSVSLFVSTTIGVILFYIGDRYLPESPRWLINKGRTEDAYEVLERIAHTNGKTLSPDITKKIDFLCQQRTSKMGFTIIITNKNLLKNTILLVLNRSAAAFTVFTLLFSNSNFGVNPFVAFIGKGSLQLVALYAGHVVGNKFGRRVTQCLVLMSTGFFCIILVFLTTGHSTQWIITTFSLMLLFCCECSYSLSNLQSLELHPTSIRQIGIATEYVFVQCTLTAAPHLAHLGKTSGMHIVFSVLAAVTLIMSALMSFVPESFNEKVPEAKNDISLLGKNHKYWSLPTRK
ncbi:solute carrier family 22 member 13-like [Schistocerca gregaria]|uniref:solute carrier family 22 member 13-like n=1 Tax=Schistocerca gregaria TaxID=7010 RepID=UPI00211E58F7|nr:solute carrier family 22 member 13-like [Schistocerca gregaria]